MDRADATARTAPVSTVDTQPAPPREDAAYAQGWMDAVRAARTAMRVAGSWKPDEYYEGWMDAATLQPVDPARLAESRSRYARGYAAGAKQYELGQRGGYDAE